MKEITIESERDLNLRPSVDFVFDETEMNPFFIAKIVELMDSSDSNVKLIAKKYFEDSEGDWFLRTENRNVYIHITPSEINNCDKTKAFFDELLVCNESDIQEVIDGLCSSRDLDDL